MKSYVRGKKKTALLPKDTNINWTLNSSTHHYLNRKRKKMGWKKKEKGKMKNELHQNQELIKE